MSPRALEFVENWVSSHIRRGEADDDARARALAQRCIEDALAEGIPTAEINDAFDDLAAFIRGQVAEANEQRAGRVDDLEDLEVELEKEAEPEEDGDQEKRQ